MSLSIEEQFKREEIFRQFMQTVRRSLIILSVFPDEVVEDIATSLMFLGAGVVQVETILSYPEIASDYISKIETEIYSAIEELEDEILSTISKLRELDVFQEFYKLLQEKTAIQYDEIIESLPDVKKVFEELEQRIRDLV